MPASPGLFDLPPQAIPATARRPEDTALATRIPRDVRFGTMSWSYPGWRAVVYDGSFTPKQLADHGLTAYAQHPLLRAVEVDRTYYEPVAPSEFARLAAQTPDDFRFVVKAHEDVTVRTFPSHARYGKKRGESNPRYLDAAYASDAVVAPAVAGLGSKLGALLLQFPPQNVAESPSAFAERLHGFLRGLPQGVVYAVEIRNESLFTVAYADALAGANAVHSHNVWPGMPALLVQIKAIPPAARRPLLIRWLRRPGETYEAAATRYAPFDRIQDEDVQNRADIASIIALAHRHAVPAWVFVDNKAEGCAPESVAKLASALVERSV